MVEEDIELYGSMDYTGRMGPWRDLRSLTGIVRAIREFTPTIVHTVGLKPIVLGALASRLSGGRPHLVHAVAGFGHHFAVGGNKRIRSAILAILRRVFSMDDTSVIVQTREHRDLLLSGGKLDPDIFHIVPGSGAELVESPPRPLRGTLIVAQVGRMIWTKGVGDFVEAARWIRKNGEAVKFVLVGEPDEKNAACIDEEVLLEWEREGVVEYWGWRDDMEKVWSGIDVLCLPTYYGEGIPKVLIEGAAAGIPIIASDLPGCREIVRDGLNGILIEPRNVTELVGAIQAMRNMPRETLWDMGHEGRRIVAGGLSTQAIVRTTMRVYSRGDKSSAKAGGR